MKIVGFRHRIIIQNISGSCGIIPARAGTVSRSRCDIIPMLMVNTLIFQDISGSLIAFQKMGFFCVVFFCISRKNDWQEWDGSIGMGQTKAAIPWNMICVGLPNVFFKNLVTWDFR